MNSQKVFKAVTPASAGMTEKGRFPTFYEFIGFGSKKIFPEH
jgi:hypothetical protein